MEILGKLVKVLPDVTGTSSKGKWIKNNFVIETSESNYAKQVCFISWEKDKGSLIKNINIGDEIKVYFSLESREFNGRWYTELNCFRVDELNLNKKSEENTNTEPSQEDDDLPF